MNLKNVNKMLQSRIALAEEYIKFRQCVAFQALIKDTREFCENMTMQQKSDTKHFLQTYVPTNSDLDIIIQECKAVL
jgi:hypothetical protein